MNLKFESATVTVFFVSCSRKIQKKLHAISLQITRAKMFLQVDFVPDSLLNKFFGQNRF